MKQAITAQAQAQAETLIRTAIAAEFNTARLIAFAAEGVQIIEWVAVLDDATTDECLELNGKQWYMAADPEDYANYIPIGHDIPMPGSVSHWNCRSLQVPVMPEEGDV
jgi:SPP1 gp7 family putative phage head morphogenesis protein